MFIGLDETIKRLNQGMGFLDSEAVYLGELAAQHKIYLGMCIMGFMMLFLGVII
jgi:hypothetical protein